MQKIYFSIFIKAPREKVWDTILSEDTYREWASVFNPGSYFKGSWEEGSKMLFLGPNPEGGTEGGMVSRIKENRLHKFISIEHLGIINNGVEDTTSEEAKKWSSSYENYTFLDKDGGTEVLVDLSVIDEYTDMFEEYKDMFEDKWPAALLKLKELAER